MRKMSNHEKFMTKINTFANKPIANAGLRVR